MTKAILIISVCLGLVVVALVQRRRYQRRIDALMSRLERIEQAEYAEYGGADDRGEGEVVTGDRSSADAGGAAVQAGSRDVLAGKTSFVRRVVDRDPSQAQGLAERAIFAVYRQLEEQYTPSLLAEELHISLRTLERGLALELGCTPRQLILAMKMRAARDLLLTGRFRVNEVATKLAFSSPFHFSSSFKTFYRVTPSHLVKDRQDS